MWALAFVIGDDQLGHGSYNSMPRCWKALAQNLTTWTQVGFFHLVAEVHVVELVYNRLSCRLPDKRLIKHYGRKHWPGNLSVVACWWLNS
jgi:hypothetical protein